MLILETVRIEVQVTHGRGGIGEFVNDHVCCQFETAYQLVLQSHQSPSINIREPHPASSTLTSLSLAAPANNLVSLCLQLTKATVLAESSLYLI